MSTPLLATKLYIPPRRPNVVQRSQLLERLNAGLHCKLTLISAPAGFGKTTLLSEWVAGCGRPAAWLSLDEGDKEPHASWLTWSPLCGRLRLALEKGCWVRWSLPSHRRPRRS